MIQRCIISRDSTSVSRTKVCLNPCPKFIICDNLFKRQCYENFNPVFMVLTNLGSLFICWSIFAFLYLHSCEKNYAVSLTSGSFIWHRGVISNFIVITFNWFSRDSQSKKGHGGTFVHSTVELKIKFKKFGCFGRHSLLVSLRAHTLLYSFVHLTFRNLTFFLSSVKYGYFYLHEDDSTILLPSR